MSQSKRHSAIETATNTAVGFVGSYFITLACLHAPGNLATQTLYATLGCTAWSLLRGYFLRRWFNHLHVKRVAAGAGMEVRVHADTPSAYLQVASGAQLDRLGMLYTLPRWPAESDSKYRKRIWLLAKQYGTEPRYCPHGEEADIGCAECREEYLEMRRDDQRNYESRG